MLQRVGGGRCPAVLMSTSGLLGPTLVADGGYPSAARSGNAAHSFSTHGFSAQLYCSGSEEQACPNGMMAGDCFWFMKGLGKKLVPITHADVNRSRTLGAADQWDPNRAGVASHRYFNKSSAAACLSGKRIHIAGDSTSRDTFYEVMAVGSNPIFTGGGEWRDQDYMPRNPQTSMGRDKYGLCLGDLSAKRPCLRDVQTNFSDGTIGRTTFQFLMQSNSTWEAKSLTLVGRGPIDAAFVQCPFFEWFRPDAYDYTKTKEERARTLNASVSNIAEVGPLHMAAIGVACRDYIESKVRPAMSANGKIYMLGLVPPPGWTQAAGGPNVSKLIFNSLNTALGLQCHKRHQDGLWSLHSRYGIGVIDRYAIVGKRRRDKIHPYFNAQFAIVQHMLNHLCPTHDRAGAWAGASPATEGQA